MRAPGVPLLSRFGLIYESGLSPEASAQWQAEINQEVHTVLNGTSDSSEILHAA
jgi:hypothetical protein